MIKGLELGDFDLDSFLSDVEQQNATLSKSLDDINCQIVFAIDASNSMQGYKIGAVNDCVNNVISKIRSFARGKDGSISISVIGFSSRLFRWTSGFAPAGDFKYSYVEMADGLTDFSALFDELTALADKEMIAESKKYVVLFSDGLSTEDYESNIKKWESTKLYKQIKKIAVTFDEDIEDPQSAAFFQRFVDTGVIIPIVDQEQLLSNLLQ